MVPVARDLSLHAEERGAGPPLLLLHGFTGSTRSWDALVPAWAERSRVIAVDLIGHGRSDAPPDARRYAIELAARDLAALVDTRAARPAAVLGYSLGARVALRLALDRPDGVAALVLVSGTAGIADPDERAARRARDEELAERIERDGVAAFSDEWEREPLFATQRSLPPAQRASVRAVRLAQRAHGLANSLRGMGAGAMEPMWERLAQVRAPTLVVSGALDTRYGGIAARLAAAIPRARGAIVGGAGHAPHLERPGELARIVSDFLAGEVGLAAVAVDAEWNGGMGG